MFFILGHYNTFNLDTRPGFVKFLKDCSICICLCWNELKIFSLVLAVYIVSEIYCFWKLNSQHGFFVTYPYYTPNRPYGLHRMSTCIKGYSNYRGL